MKKYIDLKLKYDYIINNKLNYDTSICFVYNLKTNLYLSCLSDGNYEWNNDFPCLFEYKKIKFNTLENDNLELHFLDTSSWLWYFYDNSYSLNLYGVSSFEYPKKIINHINSEFEVEYEKYNVKMIIQEKNTTLNGGKYLIYTFPTKYELKLLYGENNTLSKTIWGKLSINQKHFII